MGRVYHRAKFINDRGDIVPLCRVGNMKKINLKVETWTNRDEAVTCPFCLPLLGQPFLTGWYVPGEGEKAHLFAKGLSICGAWSQTVDADTPPAPDDCPKCAACVGKATHPADAADREA